MSTSMDYDVVVVGGGVAGCYTAYRLITAKLEDFKEDSPLHAIFKANGKLKVGLFEYSGRVGGRLLSADVPLQVPGKGFDYSAEFGGFRFNRRMQIVWDTAQHLNLVDEAFEFDAPENFVYLRGKRIRQAKANKGVDLPYNLPPSEAGMSPGELSAKVAETAIPGFAALRSKYQTAFTQGDWATVAATSHQYEELKQNNTVNNRPLREWTWWALKRYVLSQEAVDLLEDIGGYDSQSTAGTVATNLDETFYFPDTSGLESHGIETDWRHIKDGYAAIPGKLYQDFLSHGGKGFTLHQLLRFDKSGDGYSLNFYSRSRGENDPPSLTNPNRVVQVTTQCVVLAMPKRSLELLEQNNFFFGNTQVFNLLNTVDNVNAIRIFLAYPKAWWQDKYPALKKGRSTTDLGVRQFYYWFTESDPQANALVLASYSNGPAEAYWQGLQAGSHFDSLSGSLNSQSTPEAPQRRGPRNCSITMAEQAHQQLMEFHGVTDAPKPYYAHFQNWSKDPFGGGWHSWKVGQDEASLIPQIRQPVSSEKVYIVGECWSNVQGWVWGALNSSEAMLQCNLGLQWPTWLRKQGTWLGPGTNWLLNDSSDPCVS